MEVNKMSFKFTTLITKGERFYVAKCLELGVVSQGKQSKMLNRISKKQSISI